MLSGYQLNIQDGHVWTENRSPGLGADITVVAEGSTSLKHGLMKPEIGEISYTILSHLGTKTSAPLKSIPIFLEFLAMMTTQNSSSKRPLIASTVSI